MSEQIYLKIEVLKTETLRELEACFRKKVQLDEEMKENEAQLQVRRGALIGFDKALGAIREIEKGKQIEDMKAKRAEMLAAHPGGDGKKDVKEIQGIKA